ncbi:MAG: Smr/MutS family protein, partial [Cyanobacteria bacterium P01_H01_bin.15]
DERFENASVEFNDETLSPTYRLLWGIPGRSNALKIAQRLGLNTDIIDAAETQVGGLTADVNVVIAGLEAQRREQEAKSAAAQKLLVQTEQFYQEVSNKAASLQAREQDLKRIQEQEIQSAITDAKAEIAKTIRNLQRGGTAQEAKKATDKISAIAEENLPKAKPKPLPPGYQPQVGERIRIPSLGQTAEVLAPPDENRKLSVRFGIMKMLVDLDEIESLDGKKVEPPPKPQSKIAPPPPKKESALIRTSRNTVDIRGSRVADAEMIVNNAIASAIELGSLWVIHGKGTGKLRDGVQNYLRQHPLVKRYELAPQKEGGSGVTIAFLN